ncbi:MAG: hypothetical protein H6668_19080 [Ardenticatenaceae bacterium]|nr:hypothetical protein [Ardenticatenaceae bacterium]
MPATETATATATAVYSTAPPSARPRGRAHRPNELSTLTGGTITLYGVVSPIPSSGWWITACSRLPISTPTP